MDRRDFLKLGAVAVVGLSSSCAYQFVKSKESLREDIKTILENVVTLKTHTKYDGGEGNLKGEGLIAGDYIITCDHIVSMYGKFEQTVFGEVYVPILAESDNTKLNDSELETVLKNYKRDIAIFKLPKDYQKPKPVRLGDDDKLKLLDDLYLIGDAFDRDYVVRYGQLGKEEITTFPSDPVDAIGRIFTGKIVPGDSGSPLINNEGEVIGIASNTTPAYGIFKPINWYREVIE